jgi:hypothetical protein
MSKGEVNMSICRRLGLGAVLLFLCVRLAPSTFCKDVALEALWTPQAVKLDGARSDWPEGSLSLLVEKQVSVGLCNDSERVYIMLTFRNPQWAHLIRMSGLTLWLDPKGKKDKQFMIRFTGGPDRDQIRAAMGKGGDDSAKSLPPEMQQRMSENDRKHENALFCFQKDNIEEKQIPMDGTEGPAAAFGIDQGFFVYEFSVPLKASVVRNYGIGVNPGTTIGLGLIWGEMDKGKMGVDRPHFGGFPGGEGGGRGGMAGGDDGDRMGGGRGHGGGQGFPGGSRMGQGMPEKQEIWLKAQLIPSGSPATEKSK